jgi:N-acyl-D-aspartate/D-glutamate deacylase
MISSVRSLRRAVPRVIGGVALLLVARPLLAQTTPPAAAYDVVIRNGRVIDPETKLDAVRTIGIRNGKIAAITTSSLSGRQTIDASGLVVAPGFIDLHAHGQDDENYRLFALDGVTTALELEVGTEDVPRFYADRAGKALINFGAAASHLRARMLVLRDNGIAKGTLLPLDSAGHTVATAAQIAEIRRVIDRGLDAGGLGVGMGLQYTPAATKYEVLEAFRSASRKHARCSCTPVPGAIPIRGVRSSRTWR